jgi:orotate phosphoribosyltransferase
MDIDKLATLVRDTALLTGDFVLSSGRRSKYYLDKYRIETRPDILAVVAEGLATKIPAGTDILAGPELGAIPLVTAVALRTGHPFLMVRKRAKDYGTKKIVEGLYEKGQKVVLIEDVLTTGTQAVNAADALVELGLEVVKIVCVIDREEGAREAVEAAGYLFDPLLTRTMMGIES